jgi:hypothetical protein
VFDWCAIKLIANPNGINATPSKPNPKANDGPSPAILANDVNPATNTGKRAPITPIPTPNPINANPNAKNPIPAIKRKS